MRSADDVPVAAIRVEPRSSVAIITMAMNRWIMFKAPVRSPRLWMPLAQLCRSAVTHGRARCVFLLCSYPHRFATAEALIS